ncbi:serine protease [Streptomyces sp. 71268]|uniref:S1 family peptidase n=1 Tax=Streptomyces sp. 71268 TaxID=3002640 RepID=UPI0023F8D90A|nr:serine protease [Streptomyces sp. 71268]WEV25710.1 serine protease [Streptomyces sp. 71268]
MNRSITGALAALALSGATLVSVGASSATAATEAGQRPDAAAPVTADSPAHGKGKPKPRPKAVTFEGTVALSNCSGAVVRLPGSADRDPALVMSNGHCLGGGFPAPGEVVVDRPSSRTFTLLDARAGDAGTVRATKVAYATMTDTDVSLYEVDATYAEIKQRFGVKPLALAAERPKAGTAISVVSGYWKKQYTCSIDGFVHELREGRWSWKDSVRYTPACQTIGGTSGSPVVDTATGAVVAVNNTGNESGGRCTDNNPCEVDESGQVTVRKGINYAQQSYQITRCVADGNQVDLSLPGCTLPKP